MNLGQYLQKYLEGDIQNKKYHIFFTGKFKPFHKGHKATYDYLKSIISQYNLNGNVYITTALKDTDFLTTEQQQKIMELSGIPSEDIINTSFGYNIPKLLEAVNGTENDVVVSAYSEKDLEEKAAVLSLPKDGIYSWKRINDLNDIKYLRPVNFVHKEFRDRGEEAINKKLSKGTGYIVVTPTINLGNIPMSSSVIRESILNKDWETVSKIVVNNEVLNYLKEIKS